MRIEIEISAEQIANTLERAGSRYWVDDLRFDAVRADGQPWSESSCWHALVAGSIARVVVFLKEPHNGESSRAVTLDTIRRGVQIIASRHPYHMAGICGDDYSADATTGDALLQAVALGEIVYG